MTTEDRSAWHRRDTYSLAEVLERGFEARCVGPDGARYLWRAGSGLRIDARTKETTFLRDPAALPDGLWFATKFGRQQLAWAEQREAADRAVSS